MLVPDSYRNNAVALITDVEQLRVTPDTVAKVVIDEQSGTIVMGENVRISTVAIAQGNLTIRITETPQVSQPQPFSNTGRSEEHTSELQSLMRNSYAVFSLKKTNKSIIIQNYIHPPVRSPRYSIH